MVHALVHVIYEHLLLLVSIHALLINSSWMLYKWVEMIKLKMCAFVVATIMRKDEHLYWVFWLGKGNLIQFLMRRIGIEIFKILRHTDWTMLFEFHQLKKLMKDKLTIEWVVYIYIIIWRTNWFFLFTIWGNPFSKPSIIFVFFNSSTDKVLKGPDGWRI